MGGDRNRFDKGDSLAFDLTAQFTAYTTPISTCQLYYKEIGNVVWAFDNTVFAGNILTFTASDDYVLDDVS